LADLGDHVVSEADQVPVVDGDLGVRQRGAVRQLTESPAAGLPFYDQALTLARDRGGCGTSLPRPTAC